MVTLRKVGKLVWEIPREYRRGMRVPARIFADEYLLQKMKSDRTLEQAANVAMLPGIYKYSIVLPDGHQGYGFPIGGVAAFDSKEGVLSPGGVGYDINCLPPGTKVLTEFGYWISIEKALGESVLCVRGGRARATRAVLALHRKEDHLYVVTTKTGLMIKATADHPVMTPRGMINVSELKPGMRIATHPFEGVEYKPPEPFTILDEQDFDERIRKELRRRGLLPLRSDNPKLPLLVKLLGYFIGGGSFDGKKTWFYGSREGLEELRRDVERLGYKPSRILTRRRGSKLGGREFTSIENSIYVSAKSFRALLERLGAPPGRKTTASFRVPEWVKRLPKWMKRLFLAAYFGAEMNKPQTVNGYNFEPPYVSLSKSREALDSGYEFLYDIAELAREFGVEVRGIREEYSGDSVRLKLVFSAKPESLLNLWSKIGYVYCPERRRLALAAVSWIRWKLRVVSERRRIAVMAAAARGSGATANEIFSQVSSPWVNRRFIERSMYEGRRADPRVPQNFPKFESWAKERIEGDVIWDEVEDVRVELYDGHVYDITVEDEAHNFIAEGIVVSNCGVRILRTDLRVEDVKPVLKQLVDLLFRYVPAGLGSTGRIRLTRGELDRVLAEGVEWAVERGYGWSEDPEYIEERGSMRGADPTNVSDRAKDRGRRQLGSLGSGNHFLEIQVVDKIYDPRVARELGIEEEGQVTVMIHTGSRGLGHQVCSDYLRVMERAARRYRMPLPDRELVSVPAGSREAEDYFSAMKAAANFAWTNRQLITHWVREVFSKVFKRSADELGMHIVYDVAHNIAKLEEHTVDGGTRRVYVHRKGATRAFPPGHPLIPAKYKAVGQPVLIPGSMGTASYILVGTRKAMDITFGSAPHGAGRFMSRQAAKREYRGSEIKAMLERRGIIVRAASMAVVAEEAPGAYKDVDRVAEVADRVGIARRIVRLVPISVVKG